MANLVWKRYMHVSDFRLKMTGVCQITAFRALFSVEVPYRLLECGSRKDITSGNHSKIKDILKS